MCAEAKYRVTPYMRVVLASLSTICHAIYPIACLSRALHCKGKCLVHIDMRTQWAIPGRAITDGVVPPADGP